MCFVTTNTTNLLLSIIALGNSVFTFFSMAFSVYWFFWSAIFEDSNHEPFEKNGFLGRKIFLYITANLSNADFPLKIREIEIKKVFLAYYT